MLHFNGSQFRDKRNLTTIRKNKRLPRVDNLF